MDPNVVYLIIIIVIITLTISILGAILLKYNELYNKVTTQLQAIPTPTQDISPMQLDIPQGMINATSVINYDRSKLLDPLVNPNRRPNRYELPDVRFQSVIDLATRGYPDSYILMGLLIQKCKNKRCKNKDNKVLKLFGRQEYPGSDRYEYYALDDNYGNYIKYPIDVRQNELYDGDQIFVTGFTSKFELTLYKYDMPRYYPHII